MKNLLLALLVFIPQSYAGTSVAKNNLYIETEEALNEIIKQIKNLYSPIFTAQGGNLVMVADWDNELVKASAVRNGNDWEIHLYGGFARAKTMTADGLKAVICHEIGHQLGGLPKKALWWGGSKWSAAEGQADYFTTSKCLKHVFAEANNVEIVKTLNVPLIVEEKCSSVYAELNDKAICIRSALAGHSLAITLAQSQDERKVPAFETPSKKVVSSTIAISYPSVQCRLDTYFQGALCDQPSSIYPTDFDINEGYCSVENGYEIGLRPLCWFNPNTAINPIRPTTIHIRTGKPLFMWAPMTACSMPFRPGNTIPQPRPSASLPRHLGLRISEMRYGPMSLRAFCRI